VVVCTGFAASEIFIRTASVQEDAVMPRGVIAGELAVSLLPHRCRQRTFRGQTITAAVAGADVAGDIYVTPELRSSSEQVVVSNVSDRLISLTIPLQQKHHDK
jgi:hypothetical protein